MADTRLGTAAELWNFLSEVGMIIDQATTPGSTTVATATDVGDTTIPVADESNFSAGDLLRVGSGETLEVATCASTSAGNVVIQTGLEYAHAVGEAVVEQVKVDLGHVAEGGVQISVAEDVFEVRASTSALVLSRRTTGITETISWPGILWNASNFAAAFGRPDSDVLGSGTPTDPYAIRVNPDEINTLLNASLYAQGVREDGDIIEFRGWNALFDLNKSTTLARNAVAELPFGAQVKTIELLRWTPA